MNKRQEKKQARRNSKVSNRLLRLVKRWSEFHSNLIQEAQWTPFVENITYKVAEKRVSKLYNAIQRELEAITGESMYCNSFSVVDYHEGENNGDGEYVDQSCGWSGDDFTGYYYYPIGNGKYLRFYYE